MHNMTDTILPKDTAFDPVEDIRAKNFKKALEYPYLFVYLENGSTFLLSFKKDNVTKEYMIIEKHLYYKPKGKLFKKKLGRIVGLEIMGKDS